MKVSEWRMDGNYLQQLTLISDTGFLVHFVFPDGCGWKLPKEGVVEIHIIKRKIKTEIEKK